MSWREMCFTLTTIKEGQPQKGIVRRHRTDHPPTVMLVVIGVMTARMIRLVPLAVSHVCKMGVA
jgi:hypothetical protein